jgi:hypothetical protein
VHLRWSPACLDGVADTGGAVPDEVVVVSSYTVVRGRRRRAGVVTSLSVSLRPPGSPGH